MTHFVLDARQLLCPLPVIRAQNRVAELSPGDTLEVQATDPGALHDIPAWCRVHGHEVLETRQEGHEVIVRLRVVA
ncbi:MAG: sulfurtransferase TusA family protein [Sulfuricaulis sp.]|nr:sulfurtransferase TusA family protein [Sulfuricaulis sp.]